MREKDFYGLIDLVNLRGYAWSDESGLEIIEVDIPEDMVDLVEAARERLVEAAAEANEDLLEKYLESGNLEKEDNGWGHKDSNSSKRNNSGFLWFRFLETKVSRAY